MKKIFSAILLMAAMAFSVSTFVSCNDLTAEMQDVNELASQNADAIKAIKEKVAALETAIGEAQADIDAAEKAIAVADKNAGDALKEAQAAKALAEANKATLENAAKTLTDLEKALNQKISDLQTSLAGKVSQETLNAAIDQVKKDALAAADLLYVKVADLDAKLAAKVDKSVYDTKIAKLVAADGTIERDLDALELLVKAHGTSIDSVANVVADLLEAREDILDLINDEDTGLEALGALIDSLRTDFTALYNETVGGTAVSHKARIETAEQNINEMLGRLDAAEDNITKLQNLLNNDVLGEGPNSLKSRVETAEQNINEMLGRLDAAEASFGTVFGIMSDRLTSIAFVPECYVDGVPAIHFTTIYYKAINDKKDYFSAAPATAKYRLNPKTVAADCADFSFVGDLATVHTTKAAPAAPIDVIDMPGNPAYDEATGYMEFKVEKNVEFTNEKGKIDIVALKATLKKGLTAEEIEKKAEVEVYSEYATVHQSRIEQEQLKLSDKDLLAEKEEHHYTESLEEAKALVKGDVGYYTMYYDQPFVLDTLVTTCLEEETSCSLLDLQDYGFSYEFSVLDKFEIPNGTTVTDQQTVIAKVEDKRIGSGVFKATTGKEAIGRTPILVIDLKHGQNVVKRAYVKVEITVERVEEYIVKDFTYKRDYVIACPAATGFDVDVAFSEEAMRDQIYRHFDISHEEFWDTYSNLNFAETRVLKNNEEVTGIPAPALRNGDSDDGVATKKIVWRLKYENIGKIGEKTTLNGYYTLKNKYEYSPLPAYITFEFELNFTVKEPSAKFEENDMYWSVNGDTKIYQANVNVPDDTYNPDTCLFETEITGDTPWKKQTFNYSCQNLDKGEYRIAGVYMGNYPKNERYVVYNNNNRALQPVKIAKKDGETIITLDKNDNDIKDALNSATGVQAVVEYVITTFTGDEYVVETFMVNFIRPITLNAPGILKVQDAVDNGSVIELNAANLITDWRGFPVTPAELVEWKDTTYNWIRTCSPADHAVWVPAREVVDIPASLTTKTQTVKFPVGSNYYKAEAVYTCPGLPGVGDSHSVKGVGYGITETAAKDAAYNNMIAQLDVVHFLAAEIFDNVEFTKPELVTAKEYVEFEVITEIIYTPATYKTEGGYMEYSKHSSYPYVSDYAELYEGYVHGCYTWTKYVYNSSEMRGGDLWHYYGIKTVDDIYFNLDLEMKDGKYVNVKTDLEMKDGKPAGSLPSDATLVQDGLTLKYVNVKSPIQKAFNMFIPAYVDYGWGRVETTVQVLVEPVGTMNK